MGEIARDIRGELPEETPPATLAGSGPAVIATLCLIVAVALLLAPWHPPGWLSVLLCAGCYWAYRVERRRRLLLVTTLLRLHERMKRESLK